MHQAVKLAAGRSNEVQLTLVAHWRRQMSKPECLFYQVVGVYEYDRAMDFLRKFCVLVTADGEWLHTRVT